MSGLLTPIASMPGWAQWITVVNPFRYIISSLRFLYIRPVGLVAVAPDLLKLCAFGVVTGIWAVLSYKKSS